MDRKRSEDSERPLVFHANGGFHLPLINKGPVYANIIEQCLFQSPRRQYPKPNNLDILLCHNYPVVPLTERCLNHLGIAGYQVLGREIIKFRKFFKIPLVLEYLKRHSTAEYVLHLDAKDVLLVDDPKIIVERFTTLFSCDILFNAEKISYPSLYFGLAPEDQPKVKRIEQFEASHYTGPFSHLNSGCFIGRRVAIIEMLEEAVAQEGFLVSFPNSDQAIIRDLHRSWYPRIQIDHQCRIFQSLDKIKKEELKAPYPIGAWTVLFGTLKSIYWNFVLQPLQIPRLVREQMRFTYRNWTMPKN